MKKTLIALLLALPGVSIAADCPVDSCAACGTITEWIGRATDVPSKQALAKSAGACKLWVRNGQVWGCIEGGKCERQATYTLPGFMCAESLPSATACEARIRGQLSKANCGPRKITCLTPGQGFPFYGCTVEMVNCKGAIWTNFPGPNEESYQDKLTCPVPTVPVKTEDFTVCKWPETPAPGKGAPAPAPAPKAG